MNRDAHIKKVRILPYDSEIEIEMAEKSFIRDYATGRVFEEKPEELIRQRVEHFLIDDRGYDRNDLEVEKRIEVSVGREKREIRADIVVNYNKNPFLVIECKSLVEEIDAYKKQALSYSILLALLDSKPAEYTIISNWRDTVVYETLDSSFPLSDEITWIPHKNRVPFYMKKPSVSSIEIEEAKRTAITFTDPKRIADKFDECHNILRTQKGLDARERLYEMCKIITLKLYEERREKGGEENRFATRALKAAKQVAINEEEFINRLFIEMIEKMDIFDKEERIELRPHVVNEIIEIFEPFSLLESGEDVLGIAFEVFLKETMTGKELGEFFTPREIVNFMIKLVDPQPGETILDPACGTGGFLLYAYWYLLDDIGKKGLNRIDVLEDLKENLWGIDIYRHLVKLCIINLSIHGCGSTHIYRANSLDLIDDKIPPIEVDDKNVWEKLKDVLKKGGFDIILTNPPFGSGYRQRERNPHILSRYELSRGRRGVRNSQIPQILFIELCLKLLRPGGKMAIVLPDSILNNLSLSFEKTRDYIMKEAVIEAVVDLPHGSFLPYGPNTKASILYVHKKKDHQVVQEDCLAGLANEVGYDRHTKQYRKIPKNDLPQIFKKMKKLIIA